MQTLRPAQNRRQRLNGHSSAIISWLLCRERAAARLTMEAQTPGLLILRAEPLPHNVRPQAAGGAEFRHFLKNLIVGIEEERQLRCKIIHVETRVNCSMRISDSVGKRKGNFLTGGPSSLPDVLTPDP